MPYCAVVDVLTTESFFAVVSLIQHVGTVCWSEFADVLASSTDV